MRSGGVLFCSGQVAARSRDRQARRGLDRRPDAPLPARTSSAVCAAAGAELTDAVRLGIYVTDMGSFPEVNEAYGGFFGEGPPARSTIGVAALPLGAAVEIDAIVALPS